MLEESCSAASMTVLKIAHHHQQLSVAAKDKSHKNSVDGGGGLPSNTASKMDPMMQLNSSEEAGAMVKSSAPLPPQPPPANHNNHQQITNSRPSHISFSVAALLADTRPSPRNISSPSYLEAQSPPLDGSGQYHSDQPLTSSDDELNDDEVESGQGSVVDVEVLRDSNSPINTPTPTSTPTPMTPPPGGVGRSPDMLARFMLGGGHPSGAGGIVAPVRPTPFSALAAAYSAGLQHHHPAAHHQPNSWATSPLVGHYPASMFPSATSAMGPAAAAAAFAAGLGGSPGKRLSGLALRFVPK